MSFYYGKRSAGICVVLGPKKSSTYSSEYAPGFPRLLPRIWPHLLCLVTKAISDRLLALGTFRAYPAATLFVRVYDLCPCK